MKNILLISTVLMFLQSGYTQNYRLLPTCADSTETNMEEGDTVDCSEYLRNLTERLTAVESLLKETRSRKLSCSESTCNGVRHLVGGEEVFCDNGWRVFQNRFDGSVSFDRNWQEYKVGFGDLSGEFWLGLEKLHHLTNSRSCSLRVELWNFDDEFAYAEYSSFRIGSESSNYILHVSGYSGTAGDSLVDVRNDLVHNNQPFTTRDRDNDNSRFGNCASLYSGAWWYNDCYASRLNGRRGTSKRNGNIVWSSWNGYYHKIEKTMMKLRCN